MVGQVLGLHWMQNLDFFHKKSSIHRKKKQLWFLIENSFTRFLLRTVKIPLQFIRGVSNCSNYFTFKIYRVFVSWGKIKCFREKLGFIQIKYSISKVFVYGLKGSKSTLTILKQFQKSARVKMHWTIGPLPTVMSKFCSLWAWNIKSNTFFERISSLIYFDLCIIVM